MTSPRILLLPGWQNSGPGHWQSLWEDQFGDLRVEQHDWMLPLRGDWISRLEDVVQQQNGPVLLAIPLLRRSRVDGLIFVGLTAILIYNNITQHGTPITTWLLSALALMGLYLFWIRTPKIIFKPRGFFFANVWIEYQRIKEMNLSEDGVLVMQLEQRRLLIRVRNIDDLEKIYKLLITTQ